MALRCQLPNTQSVKGGYQSGQMGQTVNLLAHAYGGSNPSPPTTGSKELQVMSP